MKVVCIDNFGSNTLTLNRVYDVIGLDLACYIIIGDGGVPSYYYHSRFRLLDFRDDRLKELGI